MEFELGRLEFVLERSIPNRVNDFADSDPGYSVTGFRVEAAERQFFALGGGSLYWIKPCARVGDSIVIGV